MGVLYEKVLQDEKKQLKERLDFLNVQSTGRDRVLKRFYEVENELKYLLRPPDGDKREEIAE